LFFDGRGREIAIVSADATFAAHPVAEREHLIFVKFDTTVRTTENQILFLFEHAEPVFLASCGNYSPKGLLLKVKKSDRLRFEIRNVRCNAGLALAFEGTVQSLVERGFGFLVFLRANFALLAFDF
jgi:hypothetical protein